MTPVDEAYVIQILPELTWISDQALREKCVLALAEAFRQGGWDREKLGQLPVSIDKVKKKERNLLVDHIRAVTRIAAAMYDGLEEIYHTGRGLRDTVLAGALLHDLGKMLEYTLEEGKPAYSRQAKLMRHPLSGSILAAKCGLPDEVVHIIANHSFEGEKAKKTLASQIVNAADNCAFAFITEEDS